MLTLHNVEMIRHDAVVVPFIRRLARALLPHGVNEEVRSACQGTGMQPDTSWLVLTDENKRGLAVWADPLQPVGTPLQRAIVQTHQARNIGEVLHAYGLSALCLAPIASPPDSWLRYEIRFEDEGFLCAIDPQLGGDIALCEFPVSDQRIVRLSIVMFIQSQDEMGSPVEVLSVWIPEIRRRGIVRMSEDERMVCELGPTVHDEEDVTLRVRIDLGEIELRVEDLLSLRKGSLLDVGAAMPLACTLSTGSQPLAQGVCELTPHGFTLRIVGIIPADI